MLSCCQANAVELRRHWQAAACAHLHVQQVGLQLRVALPQHHKVLGAPFGHDDCATAVEEERCVVADAGADLRKGPRKDW